MNNVHQAQTVTRSENPLLVASTGGHLEQLYMWARRWGVLGEGTTWVTFDNEQSRDLLKDESVVFVPYVAPRDIRGAVHTAGVIRRLLTPGKIHTVVSTGAAVAVSAGLATLGSKTRFVYIESLARVRELSMTGKIIQRMPGVERYTQSPFLESGKYKLGSSVLDDFAVAPNDRMPHHPLKVVVTVGTIRPYGFNRMLEHVESLTAGNDVVWQTGESSYIPKVGLVNRSMSRDDLIEHIQSADVVISHAGVGSILSALTSGKVPIVAARSASFHEHIDDHQRDIVDLLSQKGLILPLNFDGDDRAILERASALKSFTRQPMDGQGAK